MYRFSKLTFEEAATAKKKLLIFFMSEIDVCIVAMPGFKCNYPEMIALGFLFCITGLGSIYFLIKNLKSPIHIKERKVFNSNSLFWITMMIWMVYRGLILLIPFNYTSSTLLIFQGGVNVTLALIPISLLVLLTCELLFSYRNPGYKIISFFRCVFAVFVFVFLVTGIAISFIPTDDNSDSVFGISLWSGCTDLLILVFVVIPAYLLIDAISYPIIQPDDIPCVNQSKFGLSIFGILFFLRSLYNILHYLKLNPISTWLSHQQNSANIAKARAFTACFTFIFEYCTGILAMIGSNLIRKHDLKFAEDPFYARGASDSLIVAG